MQRVSEWRGRVVSEIESEWRESVGSGSEWGRSVSGESESEWGWGVRVSGEGERERESGESE